MRARVCRGIRRLSDLDPGRWESELLLAGLALRAVIPAGFNLFRNENPVQRAVAVGLVFFANGADGLEGAQRVLHLAQRNRILFSLRIGRLHNCRAQVARADAKMRVAVPGDGVAEEEPVESRVVGREKRLEIVDDLLDDGAEFERGEVAPAE